MKRLFVFALIILLTISAGVSGVSSYAFADSVKKKEYTNVLEDLQKDESFSESYYPVVADDYSLQMVQIAESSDKELFVYLYQPSGQVKDLRAASINISLAPRENVSDFRNYKLKYLNSSGTLYKYLVDGLTVNTAETRYYTITTVLRPFDGNIDDEADHGNTVDEVEYAVSKEYCFSVMNGKPFCRVLDIDTIEITDKFVGFVRYTNGFAFYPSSCDSHFVAFSTDRDIDRLLEADVYYEYQDCSWSFVTFVGERYTFGDRQEDYAYLSYEQKVEHTGSGWFAPTYTWNRIETVDEFLAENNVTQNVYSGALINVSVANQITEEGIAALEGKQWVLRFLETEYSTWSGSGSNGYFSTLVGDVMILRLKFETDGVTYNLGVIDNKQTGSGDPVNEEEVIIQPSDGCKSFLSILLILVLLILLAPFLPYIIKGIIWIISLPFKLIAAIVKAFKKKE